MIAADLFAGPGGWSTGAREVGVKTIGFEWCPWACATAAAAGHTRVRADVAAYPANTLAGLPGLIASPPCTLFSAAGHGTGRDAIDLLVWGVERIFAGDDVRAEVRDAIYLDHALPDRMANNAAREAKGNAPWPAEKVEAAARADAFNASLILEPARYIVAIEPEWVALEQARSWSIVTNQRTSRTGEYYERSVDETPPTLATNARLWHLVHGNQANAAVRATDQPAATIAFGHAHNDARWIGPDGGSSHLTVTEAAILQGFPSAYPWQGTRKRQFEQVGNAVPPPLAAAVVGAVA